MRALPLNILKMASKVPAPRLSPPAHLQGTRKYLSLERPIPGIDISAMKDLPGKSESINDDK